MNSTSGLLLAFACITLSLAYMGVVYTALPYTPRKVERTIRAWASALLIVGYVLVVLATLMVIIKQ